MFINRYQYDILARPQLHKPRRLGILYMSYLDTILRDIPQGPIYHYTSQRGLLGILRRKAIWATEIRYLNDAEEYRYAFSKLRERLREGQYDPEFVDAITHAADFLHNYSIFVASFSRQGDMLSQWRAYCPEPARGD